MNETTKFLYALVKRFHITLQNFTVYSINFLKIVVIFFSKMVFSMGEKKLKKSKRVKKMEELIFIHIQPIQNQSSYHIESF